MKPTIQLKRIDDLADLTNSLQNKVFDNPEYKFFWSGTFTSMSKKPEEIGWYSDALAIMYKGSYAGTISWSIERDEERVYSVAVLIAPEFLNTGIGVGALVLWIDYQLNIRNTRKLSFTVLEGNDRAKAIYDKLIDCGGRFVGVEKAHTKCPDNKYYDILLYEILKEDFKPSALFSRMLKRYKK